MTRRLTTILSIAGSDPTGGAGIQADIKAAAACGVYAMTAVTAITSQNSRGVSLVSSLPSETLTAQLKDVTEEIMPDAIKLGMMGSLENAKVTAEFLQSLPVGIPVVIDPVATSSAGGDLCNDRKSLRDFYKEELFPLATVCTPNIPEALSFLDYPSAIVSDNADGMKQLAKDFLNKFHSNSVVLKGGHSGSDILTDLLMTADGECVTFRAQKLNCKNLHGTGCTFASMLAAKLASGEDLKSAFRETSKLIHKIIAESCDYSFGTSNYGPLNLFDYHTNSPKQV